MLLMHPMQSRKPKRSPVIGLLLSVGLLMLVGVCLRGTLLLGAADHGNASLVRLLLKAGTDPDSFGWYIPWDRTPLMLAASRGSLPTVRLLIAHGADVNTDAEDWGIRPLMCAAEGGNPAVVRLLLAHGAKVDASNGSGDTALTTALACHHPDIVKILKAAGEKIADL